VIKGDVLFISSRTMLHVLSAGTCFFAELEDTAYEWAQEILAKSPTSIKMLKFAMNLTDDGMVGQQVFAGEATRLAYMTDEAKEGRDAFLEKRKPNFEKKYLP
jgi:naphthoate synthase